VAPGGAAAIIPAGGLGTRLGRRTPKQFLSLAGEPILVATARHFTRHPAFRAVVVAVPAGYEERARRRLAPLGRRVALMVVTGGASRQASVAAALQPVPEGVEVVVVHDAVRPCITRGLVDAVMDAARRTGAAICGLPIAETVKRVRGDLVEESLDRSGLWTIQTPQAFHQALLREAHDQARRDGVTGTDDAMLVERLGHPVAVVEGSEANVKITTRGDLRRARRAQAARARRARGSRAPRGTVQ
jgi:2-C-methyl-D-erythritol 4-phosphate cytidylyltransferase